MSPQNYGIHWFRRDLRVAGNGALLHNFKRHQGRVIGFFCFDKEFLARSDFSANRFAFFIETLIELQKELRALGSDLLFYDIGPTQAFPQLFKDLQKNDKSKPRLVSWNRDYEPFARSRDEKMVDYFKQEDTETYIQRDHLLIEPSELSKKGSDEPYQVYSPFARRWLEIFSQADVQKRLSEQKNGFKYLENRLNNSVEKVFSLKSTDLLNVVPDNLAKYKNENLKKLSIALPQAGSLVAYKSLKSFKERLQDYSDQRDIPSQKATSGFSLFLKNGSLTVPQIISFLDLKPYKKKKTSSDTFLSELIWREFYYHILFHFPRVEKESFLPQYKNIKWDNNKEWFEHWKAGKTGFPIVDAGMRELRQTGWMHNRVRMIVASFLTKDLLIDWRWGEKYFMEQLLDGDLAPNNGGWQWAASTGCDPQPYFRIFNPWLQSQKFDPEGAYIKKFIPELKNVLAKDLHAPLDIKNYPKPIVDHHEQKEKALKLYKS